VFVESARFDTIPFHQTEVLIGKRCAGIQQRDSLGGIPMATTRIPLSAAEEASRTMEERLNMSTAEIGLTVRTTNCLEERGIFTVADLLHTKREDLLSISNFGEKTLEEVYKALEKFEFYRPKQAK